MSRWRPVARHLVLASLSAIAMAVPGCRGEPESRPGAPEVIRTGERIHVIGAGETLPSIARRYGVTEQSIRERNPGLVPDSLAIGKELRIPPSKPEVRRVEPASAPPR